jgi:hypothetical protein
LGNKKENERKVWKISEKMPIFAAYYLKQG